MTWQSLVLVLFLPSAFAQDVVRYTDATSIHQNPNNRYFVTLLNSALDVTVPEYGSYQLQAVDVVISQGRQLRELEKGTFDVFWSMTTPAREVDALAVQEPLIKGAYGLRLLVGKREYLGQLQPLKDLADLRTLAFLSGSDWPDTAILRSNNLTVTTALHEKDLYIQLLENSHYVFPRGLLEAQAELDSRNNAALQIVPAVILRYPAKMKFFVAKDNSRLAERLTKGIAMLKQSGRFDDIFYQFVPHVQALARLPLNKARIIELQSPFMLSEEEEAVVRAEQDALLRKLGVVLPKNPANTKQLR